jgi:hypothetical protein
MSISETTLPINVQRLISEYAKPLTRPDWRTGSNCCNIFKYSMEIRMIHQRFLNYLFSSKEYFNKYELVRRHSSFIQDMQTYGEDIFEISPSLPGYNNFYFLLKRNFMLKHTGLFSVRQLFYGDTVLTEIEHTSELK